MSIKDEVSQWYIQDLVRTTEEAERQQQQQSCLMHLMSDRTLTSATQEEDDTGGHTPTSAAGEEDIEKMFFSLPEEVEVVDPLLHAVAIEPQLWSAYDVRDDYDKFIMDNYALLNFPDEFYKPCHPRVSQQFEIGTPPLAQEEEDINLDTGKAQGQLPKLPAGFGLAVEADPRRGSTSRALEAINTPMPQLWSAYGMWNVEKCPRARCTLLNCVKFHSRCEQVCHHFANDGWCWEKSPNGGCVGGLHIKCKDVCKVFDVDVGNQTLAFRTVTDHFAKMSQDDKAKYVRLITYNFNIIDCRVIAHIASYMPLLYDLVIPDRERDQYLIDALREIVKHMSQSNPRLRYIIFAGGVCEAIW
jgi:hypothetical protein